MTSIHSTFSCTNNQAITAFWTDIRLIIDIVYMRVYVVPQIASTGDYEAARKTAGHSNAYMQDHYTLTAALRKITGLTLKKPSV